MRNPWQSLPEKAPFILEEDKQSIFDYASKRFRCNRFVIPSQHYTFHLVEEALKRNALVVVMRSKTLWEQAIPLLKEYPYYTLKVPQVAAISEKNCPEGYQAIVNRLG